MVKRLFGRFLTSLKEVERDDGFVRVKPQWVRHQDGWEVKSANRYAVAYENDGRRAQIRVERGREHMYLYVDEVAWVAADGSCSPIDDSEMTVIIERLVAGLRSMGADPVTLCSDPDI